MQLIIVALIRTFLVIILYCYKLHVLNTINCIVMIICVTDYIINVKIDLSKFITISMNGG
jgi:hypothetical protein